MESHGEILGLVPYDFRFPTLEKVRERMWNPEDGRILQPRVFGIGWTLNLYQLREKYPPLFYVLVGVVVIGVLVRVRGLLRR